MGDVHEIFPRSCPRSRSPRYEEQVKILSCRHPKLKRLMKVVGSLEYEIPIWTSVNDAVLYAVIGQMLSVKAAKSIIQKLVQRFHTSEAVICWAKHSLSRDGPIFGVSWRKRKALAEWERFIANNPDLTNKWGQISLAEYKKQITSVWGLGNWSADMIAIFHLGRMDVFPETDTGIKKACRDLFGTNDFSGIRKCIAGCETVTALYLWEALDRKMELADG